MTRLIPGRDRPGPGGARPATVRTAPARATADLRMGASRVRPLTASVELPAGLRPGVRGRPPVPRTTPPTLQSVDGPLPDDPARALWAAYRRAPERALRDRLVLHYRPLVRAVVRRTADRLPAHVEPADLLQSGVFGLIEAIERYDPARCPRFETYAAPRIRGAVLDELRAQDWVPRTVRLRAREAARAREDLTVRLRRTATDREVADALQVGPRELGVAAPTQLLSIERLCEGADGGALDAFADQTPDPAAAAQDRESRRQLLIAVARLGERDRLVVRLYYVEQRTLAEIGRMLGVTESRICQLHTRLVGRLRGTLEELAAG
jgi:RNA polymerase sigma factor FliA